MNDVITAHGIQKKYNLGKNFPDIVVSLRIFQVIDLTSSEVHCQSRIVFAKLDNKFYALYTNI